MRKKLFLGAIAATALISWAAKDPVLMKINGDGVKLSEFEYLYHKNNQQQIEKETLDQYLDRFVVYKLKVADAKAAGIDTTSAFKNEFNKYRNDLARPYLMDSTALKKLAQEAFYRKSNEVKVSHIMLSLAKTTAEMEANEAKLDSIRTCILNGEDFSELAKKYSIDSSVKRNGGSMGYIVSGRFPYEFEKVAYETPVGEISKPFKTDFGIHIVKVYDKRPSRGEVLAEHILKLYPRGGANDSVKAAIKHKMDSIYAVVTAPGANFEEIAKTESEDPGSARQGGKLPWFGAGMMVPEFENMAFGLGKDEISKPFETAYGIHIVKKLDSRTAGTYEENEAKLFNAINSDERSQIPVESKLEQLKKEYKLKENDKFFKSLEKELATAKFDSTFVEKLKNNNTVLFSFAKVKVPVSKVAEKMNPKADISTASGAVFYVKTVMRDVEKAEVFEYEKTNMVNKYPEYANLLNEYYNGMMLYEISNRNVWDKANRDTEGLAKFFNENKAKYTWEQPKFKGTVIYTTNDSIENLVKAAVKNMAADTMAVALRKQFKRDVRIERLLVQKGENPVADALAFGGEKATPKDKRYSNYFMYEGRIIAQPEEAADVRGQVTSDYQNHLEEKWVKELKEKYPVDVNKKVLKDVK